MIINKKNIKKANNKASNNNLKRAVSLTLCAFSLLTFSSCDSFKLMFAGNLTDTGISLESIAKGEVYQAEEADTPLFPISYDTVFEDCLLVGNRIMCDFYSSVSAWRESAPSLLENSYFFCNENFSVYENNHSNPENPSSSFPKITVKRYLDESGVQSGSMGDDEVKFEMVTFKCDVKTAISEYGLKKVVFCLAGINDLPIYGDEENCHKKTAEEMGKLIKDLKNSFEGLTIVVLSVPPISSGTTYMKSVNNEKIDMLNNELAVICTENGADFVQMSHLFKSQDGSLKNEFCEDGYCKLNEEGCKKILSSLRYYAKKRKGEI